MLLNVPYSNDISVFQSCLNRALIECVSTRHEPYIDITHDYDVYRICVDKIIYLEKCQRVTEVHMTDGRVLHSYLPVYRFEQMLPKALFLRISNSAIVNWRFLVRTRAYRATVNCNGKLVELGMWHRDYKWVKAELVRRQVGVTH